jgi:hypothetical protein
MERPMAQPTVRRMAQPTVRRMALQLESLCRTRGNGPDKQWREVRYS